MNIYVAVLTIKGNNSQTEDFVKADKDQIPYFQSLIKENKFLASGAQLNKDGSFSGCGVFLLCARSQEEAEELMQNDPLVLSGYSEYTITAFKPLLVNPQLKDLIER